MVFLARPILWWLFRMRLQSVCVQGIHLINQIRLSSLIQVQLSSQRFVEIKSTFFAQFRRLCWPSFSQDC